MRYRAPHKAQTPLGLSILSYTMTNDDPTTSAKICTADNLCVALNCPFQTAPGWQCIPMDAVNSTSYHSQEIEKIRYISALSAFSVIDL